MTASRPWILIGVASLCGVAFLSAQAAEVTTERPFGGPFPPKRRGIERAGTICKTPIITCKFPEAQPVGSECFCRGSDGKPVSGKVVGSSN
jgi:hypothetical protein